MQDNLQTYSYKQLEQKSKYRNMILTKLHYGMLEYHTLENEINNLNLTNNINNYDNQQQDNDELTDKQIYNQEDVNDNDYNVNYNDNNIIYDADEDDVEDGDYIF